MKKSKKISLMLTPVLSAVLFVGCGGEDETRDVYQSMDDCLKDWGNTPELCEKMGDDDTRSYQQSHGILYPVFWGPRYYPGDRAVIYQGREIVPTTRSSSLAPMRISPGSSSYSRSGVSSPRSASVSRGGFGGRGGSIGS